MPQIRFTFVTTKKSLQTTLKFTQHVLEKHLVREEINNIESTYYMRNHIKEYLKI